MDLFLKFSGDSIANPEYDNFVFGYVTKKGKKAKSLVMGTFFRNIPKKLVYGGSYFDEYGSWAGGAAAHHDQYPILSTPQPPGSKPGGYLPWKGW